MSLTSRELLTVITAVHRFKFDTKKLRESSISFFIRDSLLCYWYSTKALKKRNPRIEEKILHSHKSYIGAYAQNVIKGRWEEAEPILIGSLYWDDYKLLLDSVSTG